MTTFNEVVERYPNGLWQTIEPEQKAVIYASTEQLQDHIQNYLKTAIRGAHWAPKSVEWADNFIRTSFARDDVHWHGGNLSFSMIGNSGDHSRCIWAARMISTGFPDPHPDAKGLKSIRDIVAEHDMTWADRDLGDNPHWPGPKPKWLHQPLSSLVLLVADDESFSAGETAEDYGPGIDPEKMKDRLAIIRRVLHQPGVMHHGSIFAVDPVTRQEFYLMSTVRREQPTLPDGWRPDAPLIKHLARFNATAANLWQRLPLIVMPELTQTDVNEVEANVSRIEYQPYRDLLLDFGWIEVPGIVLYADRTSDIPPEDDDNKPLVRFIARIADVRTGRERFRQYSPWQGDWPRSAGGDTDMQVNRETTSEGLDHFTDSDLFVEAWAGWQMSDGSIPFSRPWSAFVKRENWSENILQMVPGSLNERKYLQSGLAMVKFALVGLGYLAMTNKHLVSVASPCKGKPRKGEDKKPWTREGLPHIVLMDVGTFRHRVNAGRDATPIEEVRHLLAGHHRRAHRRWLQAEKYYRNEWSTRVVPGSPVQMMPPEMDKVIYDHAHFRCGTVQTELQVWVKSGPAWQRVIPRSHWLQEQWVGPREGQDRTGNVYRVLDRENDRKRVVEEGPA